MMDVDGDSPGRHPLPELLGDHGPVPIFRGMKVFDIHGESSLSKPNLSMNPGEVNSSDDYFRRAKEGDGLRESLPTGKAKIIAGSGHALMRDAPEEFNRLRKGSSGIRVSDPRHQL
jgi:pimeloyl-ACP methyl ester carboxylesterase